MSESGTSGCRRLRAVVHGRVQGVNFRYSALDQAERLGLVGYVRNRWDGTVEVVAEGEEEGLRRLLSWLKKGPPIARVERVETLWQAADGRYDRFEVRG